MIFYITIFRWYVACNMDTGNRFFHRYSIHTLGYRISMVLPISTEAAHILRIALKEYLVIK